MHLVVILPPEGFMGGEQSVYYFVVNTQKWADVIE